MKTKSLSLQGSLLLIILLVPSVHAHESHPELHPVSQSSATANRVTISVEGAYRMIRANGIPDHHTGTFPNRNNPNRISAQEYIFRVPLRPEIAKQTTKLGMSPFGVALNGVVFDPAAAEWWNRDRQSGWQYEPMLLQGRLGADESNGHVQPTGAYHYHSIPTALLAKRGGKKPAMTQLGWAADGFPIYGPFGYANPRNSNSFLKELKSSYKVRSGVRPSGPGGRYDGTFVEDYEYVKDAGDLDECNGRFGITPEFPEGTYYYVLTKDFPFIPRQFRGTPDPSFIRRPQGGNPPGNRPGRPVGPGQAGHPSGKPQTQHKPQHPASPPERAGSAKQL